MAEFIRILKLKKSNQNECLKHVQSNQVTSENEVASTFLHTFHVRYQCGCFHAAFEFVADRLTTRHPTRNRTIAPNLLRPLHHHDLDGTSAWHTNGTADVVAESVLEAIRDSK